jgi:hypothetical protein
MPERHERSGYPLMAEDDRIVATLAGDAPSCLTCQWAEGGAYGPTVDSWRSARCERRYLELMDLEYVRWPGGGAPYRNDHRDDAACGAGTVRKLEWINRLHLNVEHRLPGDETKHDRWWRRHRPWLGEGNSAVAHPPCIHWRSRRLAPLDVTALWAEFDKESAIA